MRKLLSIITALSLLLVVLNSQSVFASENHTIDKMLKENILKERKENEILIQYKQETNNNSSKIQLLSQSDSVETVELNDYVDQKKIINQLEQMEDVQFVEENKKVYVQSTTIISDPYYELQWALDKVAAPEAWEVLTEPGEEVVVGVIDTGVDLQHEDLQGKILQNGYNFIDESEAVYDMNGHGTAVSGVIAASINNDLGIAGVTGKSNVKILPLQAGFSDGSLYLSDIVEAIDYAIEQNVDVLNLSFGSPDFSNIEYNAIQRAVDNGIIVVASAGNNGNSEYMYPASYHNVISVGSIDQYNNLSNFSTYNDKVDIVAPGEEIVTTTKNNQYTYQNGTSFSAPIVSGIIASIISEKQNVTLNEIMPAIQETSVDLGPAGKDEKFGYGLIDFYQLSQKMFPEIEQIIIEQPQVELTVGETLKIQPIILPTEAASNQLFWESSNNEVVTVNEEGVINGVTTGKATISISSADSSVTSFVEVNVVDKELIENETFEPIYNAALDQEWAINFNNSVDATSINNQTVQIIDSSNNQLPLEFSFTNQHKTVKVKSLELYEPNSTYKLVISKDICSQDGKSCLSKPVYQVFHTRE
ncbi:fervidolysin. Serine peptidase. MEROPS family S08A [Gracilibacillus ureilyticus]|uniref:Fervidolysin. Serine peptidase. MEROPS family S08A n=1 Tax=Gracilibacillus ureilyticus TaxID=531814 RepID=A0A1H9UMG9_9BACI|nr:S8 family serine peptidase [Gracilibacillus ureilyticus]SES10327.1 fervidolysin. Serine peptidase. MEROPS family S08A [Gracilibacillus ureilyticus]